MNLHSHNTFSIYSIQQLLSCILLIFYKFHVFHKIFLKIHTHELLQLFMKKEGMIMVKKELMHMIETMMFVFMM